MKTIYKCEKCGMEFDNFNVCSTHEQHHIKVGAWLAVCNECDDIVGVGRLVKYDQPEGCEHVRVHIDELDVGALPVPTYNRGYYPMAGGYYVKQLPDDFEKFPELIGNMFEDITDALELERAPICRLVSTHKVDSSPVLTCVVSFSIPTENNS